MADFRDFRRSLDVEDRRDEVLPVGPFGTPGLPPNVFESGDLTGLNVNDLPPIVRSQLGTALGLDNLPQGSGPVSTSSAYQPQFFAPSPNLSNRIIGVESGGNPNATNPNSSASGLGQFIDSTWLSTIKQARPDLAQGKSDADLIALKNDPDLSRQMTEAYANQNQAILQKNGLPVTPGNTYLAHFAGPGGAVKVLQADPNAMAGDVLGPAVVKANPFLANMTAKDLQAWADKKMGGSSPQPQPAQASPAAPPGAPLVLPSAQPPVFAQPPQAAQQMPPQMPQQAAPADMAQQLPADMAQAPQIHFAQRRPVNLTALRNSLQQRAPYFAKG